LNGGNTKDDDMVAMVDGGYSLFDNNDLLKAGDGKFFEKIMRQER
jgi:hypothetical protein